MGNCATKPKARGDDDAPPPAEPQTPARAAEGEKKDVEAPAVEEKSEVAAQRSEEATSSSAESKGHDEPNEKEDPEHGEGKKTAPEEGGGELPASTPANDA